MARTTTAAAAPDSESGGLSAVGRYCRSTSPRHELPLALDADRAGRPLVRVDTLTRGDRRAELLLAVRAWGQALARLHRHPLDPYVEEAPRPWILLAAGSPTAAARPGAPVHGAAGCAALDHRLHSALGELTATASVRAALSVAERDWQASSWTHGNPTAANAAAGPVNRCRWNAWLVDAGSAGRSDPSWDLVSAYDSLLRLRGQLGANLRPAVRALLDGYRSGDGPGRLSAPMVIARAAVSYLDELAAETTKGPAAIGQALR